MGLIDPHKLAWLQRFSIQEMSLMRLDALNLALRTGLIDLNLDGLWLM